MGILEGRSSQMRGVISDLRSVINMAGVRPQVAYLGWTGRGNLGDEAIFLAHRRSGLGSMATYPADRFATLVHPSDSTKALLLGGGTLIGRKDWLPRLDRIERSFPHRMRFATGVGVEDPDFAGRREYTSDTHMKSWAERLRKFDSVSVRGPLSAQILARFGIDAPVVGDPALLLHRTRESPQASSPVPLVGLNIARVEDSWGGSMDAYTEGLGAFVEYLNKLGIKCRLISMTSADYRLAREFSRAYPFVDVLAFRNSVEKTLHAIQECTVVMGPRLHLCILAAAVEVPFVSIMYKPKCLDFALSVNMDEWTIPSNNFSAHRAMESIDELLLKRDSVRDALERHVSVLRNKLQTEVQKNKELVNGEFR